MKDSLYDAACQLAMSPTSRSIRHKVPNYIVSRVKAGEISSAVILGSNKQRDVPR
jgi:hypothetical protein